MRRRSRFAELVRSSVVVHTKIGSSFAGVLVGEYDDCIALAHASILSAEGPSTPLDGETLIRLDEITFAQVGIDAVVAQ